MTDPDFTSCVGVLRKACRKQNFNAADALDLLNLLDGGRKERERRAILEAIDRQGNLKVDRGALDNMTIAILAGFYQEITGHKPHGLSFNYAEDRRYAANPFPEFLKKFFAALGRPIRDEHLHKLIRAARKQFPAALPKKR